MPERCCMYPFLVLEYACNQVKLMIKSIFIAAVLGMSAVMVSCTNGIAPVPDNGRQVVRPKGSSDVEKSWNIITKAEGDAALGPLSNMRR